jgi:metallo-beta-lactamase family protein
LALSRILLPDSGHLQEEEADYANRHGFSRHKPARPLYTEEDSNKALKQFKSYDFNCSFEPVPGLKVCFSPNGHILGSAFISVSDGKKTIVISGDLGRPDDLLMPPPMKPAKADYLLIESTYGDRRHPTENLEVILEEPINSAVSNGGTVIVPSFAVGRAQSLLYLIGKLTRSGRIPKLPLFLDSPMAIDATEIFYKFHELHRLNAEDCRELFEMVKFTRSVAQSKEIHRIKGPKIIISASGMLTGGRVLHHLKRFLPDSKNVLIFVGFQAAGTRGANILAGMNDVKIHGEYFPVKARVVNLEGISAHADYVELGDWLSDMIEVPRKTFIVHGEPQAQDAFRLYIKDRFGWEVTIPSHGDMYELP